MQQLHDAASKEKSIKPPRCLRKLCRPPPDFAPAANGRSDEVATRRLKIRRKSGVGPSVKTARFLKFQWPLQSQEHPQARRLGVWWSCPSSCGPTAAVLHASCPSSYRFAPPWSHASNRCRRRSSPGQSTSPSHGQSAHIGGSRCEGVRETDRARGIWIQPSADLASICRARLESLQHQNKQHNQ